MQSFHQLQPSATQAAQWAATHYGLTAIASPLAGEVDFNFRLKTAEGQHFVLKVSRPGAGVEELDFQAEIMTHLATQNVPIALPVIVPAISGERRIAITDEQGHSRQLRLLSWVEGRMMVEVAPQGEGLLQSLGRACGHLSLGLAGFDHVYAHRFYKWDPPQTLHSRQYMEYMQSEEQREMANYFWQLFEQQAQPRLASLRKSVNHNDVHDYNALCIRDLQNPKVTGIIDFGDALYTQTVNELAIALAYACMGKADPLAAAKQVVAGYHSVFPLEEKEVELLFPLLCARLLITVANAAYNKHLEPDNAYLQVSEKPAWDLLTKLRSIHPAFAHYSFRQACGWEACPKNHFFVKWQNENKASLSPPIHTAGKRIARLDLSVGSLPLGNNSHFETEKAFVRHISRMLEDAEADIGVGGYREVRPFYSTDAYALQSNEGPVWRTVHLGYDIWAHALTPVHAIADGVVHSFADNDAERDYGATIILEHQFGEELTFYSLYGHLSKNSLTGLFQGKKVKGGEPIAWLGQPHENGQWPPHLHLQIMLDMMGRAGDFPGVARPDEEEIWASICPPSVVFPAFEPVEKEDKASDILAKRKETLGRGLSISYSKPLHIVRGYRQYLYDTGGRRYLDTVNNVAHVGHEHPRILRLAQQQMGVLNTNTRYLHDNITAFAEELLATFPPELSVCHFVNSGSEANELALRMAKTVSGKQGMLAVEVGYHGNTGGCIDISSYKFDGKGGKGAPPQTAVVPMPDVYRGSFSGPEAGRQYAALIGEAVGRLEEDGWGLAGFICESILSCGGQIVLPQGYLKAAYAAVRAADGLCIADEVQVGMGRVGSHFWGFELQGVIPDIVTIGKPIGNGHPLAAVVTTREVADAFANGMEYFNTFGGNPVSCIIGREVLRIVKDEGLQQHALQTGDYLRAGLLQLQQQFPLIGDVRGPGLFQGFELVKDGQLTPAAEEATYLSNRMRAHGVLMSTDGPLHNVLKIKPPMCFDRANVDFLVEMLGKILEEDFLRK